jgi:NDP-sugar pyrophosphorylase family protein
MTLAETAVAVLAGGRATRLGSLAASAPKCLLEVAGRAFLDHQLDQLERQGVRRVVLLVDHRANQVERHLASVPRPGMDVVCRRDGPRPLGTAGALRKARRVLSDPFFVLYADTYLDVDYAAVLADFERRGVDALGLMTVFRNHGRWDRSNVRFTRGRLIRYDKRAPSPDMEHIDYGLGLLRREVLSHLPPRTAADLADVYAPLAREGRLLGHTVRRRFHEIGTPAGLAETRAFLARRR